MQKKLINITYTKQSDMLYYKYISTIIKEVCKEIEYEIYDEDIKEYCFTHIGKVVEANIQIVGDIIKNNKSISNIIKTKIEKLKKENKEITYEVEFKTHVKSL